MSEDKGDNDLIPFPPNKKKGMLMATLLFSRKGRMEVTMTSLPLFPEDGRYRQSFQRRVTFSLPKGWKIKVTMTSLSRFPKD